jgi:2-amino-4-hydroxy-6-hydroxymethyldihydropteridine diphosphokinase
LFHNVFFWISTKVKDYSNLFALSVDFLRFDKKMKRFVLSLGANLGDRAAWLQMAVKRISEDIAEVSGRSSVYETEAWGNRNQPAFLNQVVEGYTELGPEELMRRILIIEKDMGRQRNVKWQARNIDIDILFYGNEIIEQQDLIIPHPMFHRRRFTLAPLMEIMPDFRDPRSGKLISEIWDELEDTLEVKRIG